MTLEKFTGKGGDKSDQLLSQARLFATHTSLSSRFWPVSNFFFCYRAEEGKDWTECEWRDIAERRRRRRFVGRKSGPYRSGGAAGLGSGLGFRGPAKAEQAEHPWRQGSSQEADLVRQWVHTRVPVRVCVRYSRVSIDRHCRRRRRRRRSEKSSTKWMVSAKAYVTRAYRFYNEGWNNGIGSSIDGLQGWEARRVARITLPLKGPNAVFL